MATEGGVERESVGLAAFEDLVPMVLGIEGVELEEAILAKVMQKQGIEDYDEWVVVLTVGIEVLAEHAQEIEKALNSINGT